MSKEPISDPLPDAAVDIAEANLRDILNSAVEHTESERAMVVWDARTPLSNVLTRAYRRCLPGA